MFTNGQKTDQEIVNEYLKELRAQKVIVKTRFSELFVERFLADVPPSSTVPKFEAVHRNDTVEVAEHKEDANKTKLWRYIEGQVTYPAIITRTIIDTLNDIKGGLGDELKRRLLHNDGFLAVPIPSGSTSELIHAELLTEFAEFNAQLIRDMSHNGKLDQDRTLKELYDSIEQHLRAAFEIKNNQEKNQPHIKAVK